MIQYLLISFLSLFIVSTPFSIYSQIQPQHDIPIIQDHSIEKEEQKISVEPDNFQGKFTNMLFILALLIGFMIVASIMLKRMTRQRVFNMNTQSTIKVMETRHLSPRSTLFLLSIAGKEILIAESQAGVSHIASFNETEGLGVEPDTIK